MKEMAAALPSSWEELPSDLLCLLLKRLPSHADRVRARAACVPWRAATLPPRILLPPPLPWLALRDGGLVDLDGARVRCAPFLREGADFGYLAVDNLAFLIHDDGGCSLMNPLSGLTLPLPQLASAVRLALDEPRFYDQSCILNTYAKVILSSPLDSAQDPLLAAIIMEGNSVVVSSCRQPDTIIISIRRTRTRVSPRISSLGTSSAPERRIHGPTRIDDIAFLHGNLYALTKNEGLLVVELDAGGRLSKVDESSSGFRRYIADDPEQLEVYSFGHDPGPGSLALRYLAESDGRLLMVRRWMSIPQITQLGELDRTLRFEVFEADLTAVPARWMKVDSLNGRSIFLGSECTKSVLASNCAGGVQEDCIYFMHRVFDNPSKEFFGPCMDPLGDSGVYNMRDGTITPLLPEAVMADLLSKRQFLTWFFPSDA